MPESPDRSTRQTFRATAGLGAFGIQGVRDSGDVTGGDENTDYGLKRGRIYNVDASPVINRLSGPCGAHSDITHPAIAALAWRAALAGN